MARLFGVAVVIALLGAGAYYWLSSPPGPVGTLPGAVSAESRTPEQWRAALTGDPAERDIALKALKSPDAVPILIQLLDTPSDHPGALEIRMTAIDLLSDLGPDAHAAGDALLSMLHDPDPLIPPLAAAAIPKVGVPAAKAIPELQKLLDGPRNTAIAVTRAISVYKGEARDLVPKFEQMLRDESLDTEVRWNACRTIGKIGPDAIDALPTLIEFLDAEEITIREHATEAIGDIGPTAASAIPQMIPLLEDDNARVRRDTVRSFGYMGEAAKQTVPAIIKLLDDPEYIVQDAAKNAILAIDPDALPKAEDAPSTAESTSTDQPSATDPPTDGNAKQSAESSDANLDGT